MTVRKERRQRGGAYWSVYWHVGGRMRKAYVGRTVAVTDARLRAIAADLLDSVQHPGADDPSTVPDDDALSTPSPTCP